MNATIIRLKIVVRNIIRMYYILEIVAISLA